MRPLAMAECLAYGLELGTGGGFGGAEVRLAQPAVREVPHREAHAAHVQALQLPRFQSDPDDAFRGAAADVHHQPGRRRRRQTVRDAEVDQPRFLAPGHHLDREAQRRLGPGQELLRVLRDAQRVGADRAHRVDRHSAQAFAELAQCVQAALLGGFVQALVGAQPGADAHRLAQRIERVDLLSDDPGDLQVEAVRTEVDSRQGGQLRHRAGGPPAGPIARRRTVIAPLRVRAVRRSRAERPCP